jgi:predicted PurR-regulated permease PerM
MELHEIVTNMSVLFGIYRFGVEGIFYGPLIIITFQCVQKELFKKYIKNKGKDNQGK